MISFVAVCQSEQSTCTVMDVIDKAMPNIIKLYLATLSYKERVSKEEEI